MREVNLFLNRVFNWNISQMLECNVGGL